MKLQTITGLELTTFCNLACKYCVNPLIDKNSDRKKDIMSDYIFDKSLELIRELCLQGTQKEIHMQNNGESTLDPQLTNRIRKVREVIGSRPIFLCTNGLTMTEKLANDLQDSGLTQLDFSPHSPYHLRRALDILNKVNFKLNININYGSFLMPHNWAGQLAPEHSVNVRLNINCDPLEQGRGYILTEGDITPCCYDYRNLGVFGSVEHGDILERDIKEYDLCETCHQKRRYY